MARLTCDKHPLYTGRRMPRTECVTCWKIYIVNTGKTLEDVSEAVASKDAYRSKWLKEFYDDILNAEAAVVPEKEIELQSSFEFTEPE
jgi:hypothetical protein